MGCPGNPVDWNEDHISLGNPILMDNATFLEWSTRQMETPEETKQRLEEYDQQHREWHASITTGYISACYINVGPITTLSGEVIFDATS